MASTLGQSTGLQSTISRCGPLSKMVNAFQQPSIGSRRLLSTHAARVAEPRPVLEKLVLDSRILKKLYGERPVSVIRREEWTRIAAEHRKNTLALLGGSTTHDTHHPIYNFLFEYYHFRPRDLLTFSPGTGPVLLKGGADDDVELAKKGVRVTIMETGVSGIMYLPLHGARGLCSDKHINSLRFAREVLRTSLTRPPVFFCYGVHEWAMLYRPPGAPPPLKYQNLPLRISQETLNAHVESKPIFCTHFDAFRFFTPEARPLNVHHDKLGNRHGQLATEQPGCLHANMDLFKWAVKLGPFVSSDLATRTLELAVEARMLDMRASPYDLSSMSNRGFDISPIAIETWAGRKEYQARQETLTEKARPLRQEVLAAYDDFFAAYEGLESGRTEYHAGAG